MHSRGRPVQREARPRAVPVPRLGAASADAADDAGAPVPPRARAQALVAALGLRAGARGRRRRLRAARASSTRAGSPCRSASRGCSSSSSSASSRRAGERRPRVRGARPEDPRALLRDDVRAEEPLPGDALLSPALLLEVDDARRGQRLVRRSCSARARSLSTLDIVFDRVLMRWRWMASIFHGITLFGCLNLVIPALFPDTRTLWSLLAAAGIAVVGFWTLHVTMRVLQEEGLRSASSSLSVGGGVGWRLRGARRDPARPHVRLVGGGRAPSSSPTGASRWR